jgi:hypothetical protein
MRLPQSFLLRNDKLLAFPLPKSYKIHKHANRKIFLTAVSIESLADKILSAFTVRAPKSVNAVTN